MSEAEETFAANARRLSALAGRLLGWKPPDFWRATPAELAAILFEEDGPRMAPLGRVEMTALMERDADG